MAWSLPLVYFIGLVPGKYVAEWPVYVVGDDPAGLAFSVAVDDPAFLRIGTTDTPDTTLTDEGAASIRRAYLTASVRRRLHQRAFRERVLDAYRRQCAFCRLRHEELLDAAHIIPDAQPEGEPHVRNGLSLCTLHHVAFDRRFLGVRPDYVIEVRPDIRNEQDGPTLVHALQALHENRIVLPESRRLRPDPALLQIRYDQFRRSFAG